MGDISFLSKVKSVDDVTSIYQDIELRSGDIVLTNDYDSVGLESMRQSIQADLQVFLGEWFLDNPENPKNGVDYFGTILGSKHPREDVLNSVFTNAIVKNKYVARVEELSSVIDSATRLLVVTFRCTSKTGLELEDAIKLQV